MNRFFGTPDGVRIGQLFVDRAEVAFFNVHAPYMAGISGTGREGADSIVLSGGYPDDEDYGDSLIYTGHGGRDGNRQVRDQSPDDSGNAGLITSWVQGLPVRVTRGEGHKSPYSPPTGYQYAGLFLVTDYSISRGREGFLMLRFRLDRVPEQAALVTRIEPDTDPAFAIATVTRRIRDTALSRKIKANYGFRCQVCGTAIEARGERLYAEGAHVRPLGRPHLGGDTFDNLLCLCPNHHTQLDLGGIVILDDFRLARPSGGQLGQLTFVGAHSVNLENVRYHRRMWLDPA
ncbi:YDG/SRA domain-containing protein [Naasia lichenicola]|uniref:HNH endonuclease n=1 Tax=Naasia lichenicola TaxID=2565933 RepID=A0A4S4FRI7_9MICO|nr:YDG/SRA domain-containing protein [Naasia lichenicola]THG33270.1 HNH endonuclease [Naasia lichenicola]